MLDAKSEKDAYRVLLTQEGVDFYSNDYVGASMIPHDEGGVAGSTGSRLISGNSLRTETIEAELAGFFGADAGLIFNSGYDANLGVMSCIPQRGDTVLYDSLCHASIRDGIKLSNAKAFSFEHNNVDSLKDKFERAEGDIYVVVESLYSMDGDFAPLEKLSDFCAENGAYLIVDEAHAGGVYGEGGRGIGSTITHPYNIFARIVTYGKAYGSHGAIVLGSKDLREFLINYARSLIYTTAISPIAQERMLSITSHVAEMNHERELLFANLIYFKNQAKKLGIEVMPSNSPIQGLIIGGNEKTNKLAEKIRKSGFLVKAILSPTVPEGLERIRICIHSFNTKEEIDGLLQAVQNG